jgi:NOL1/NOP2/sun family putative RNA methylase
MNGIKGFDRAAFEEVHASEEQVTSVRMNDEKPLKVEGLSFEVEESVPWCPHGKYLKQRPSFTLDPLLHGGAYYVQEASSMFLWHVLQQTVGKNTEEIKVLDLCAAPGGKSTLLASYFKNGFIVSNEVIKSRASVLVANITKWGSSNVVVTNNDPVDFTILQNYFDVIVVDAPCSGSGLFRKDPAAIKEWSEENVLLCSRRQRRIVADVFPALKKGGILIYSTCSYSKEEDEDILDWMMSEFQVASCRLQIERDWGIVEVESGKHNGYSYRFFPDSVKGEGFFIAALKKNDGDNFSFRYPQLQSAQKQEINIANDWVHKNDELFFFKQNENIIAVSTQWQQDVALLQKNLYLRKAGVTVGAIKGKELVPNHELVLSLLLNKNVARVHLDYEQAIQYLKKKDLVLENIMKGWVVVDYYDANLGWIKVLHNRVNNYYPANWRILKD